MRTCAAPTSARRARARRRRADALAPRIRRGGRRRLDRPPGRHRRRRCAGMRVRLRRPSSSAREPGDPRRSSSTACCSSTPGRSAHSPARRELRADPWSSSRQRVRLAGDPAAQRIIPGDRASPDGEGSATTGASAAWSDRSLLASPLVHEDEHVDVASYDHDDEQLCSAYDLELPRARGRPRDQRRGVRDEPRSRRSVRLTSPTGTPLTIDHGFLRDERDVEVGGLPRPREPALIETLVEARAATRREAGAEHTFADGARLDPRPSRPSTASSTRSR